MSVEDHDEKEQRCRILGHAVPFKYCKKLPEGRPCRLIVSCWQGYLDVSAYLEKNYTPEQIEEILGPPKPKITSIVEMIEQARKVTPPEQD
jgi:hypothetical protein